MSIYAAWWLWNLAWILAAALELATTRNHNHHLTAQEDA